MTYEHVEKRMEDSSVSILIVGNPGSGKSVIAKMLHVRFLRKWVKEKYYVSKYIHRLEDLETCESERNTKMVYIVEDCFEEWIQYPHLALGEIEKLKKIHMKVVEVDGNCLVITISKWSFEEYRDVIQKALLKHCDKLEVIDLTTKMFELDITDKTGILEFHRKKGSSTQRMGEKEVRKVIAPGSFQGMVSHLFELNLDIEFPLSCRLFYSHDSFVAQKKDFFNDTKRKIWEYVRGLARGSSEEKNQCCTLIYTALIGGKTHSKNRNLSFLKSIANVARLDLRDPQFDFRCCLITQGTDNTYEIVHEEITKVLFKAFGLTHALFVINRCEIGILLKYMRTDDRVRTDSYLKNGLLILRNNMYDHLAKRLMNLDTEKRKHIIFKDKKFKMKFRNAWKIPQESETVF